MFYCDECREKKNWPESLTMSIGLCEVCGQTQSCWDVKSYDLPLPTKSQHGREPEKVKPLAQYLVDYLQHEHPVGFNRLFWKRIIEQALDAYQSTENVTIKIERNVT